MTLDRQVYLLDPQKLPPETIAVTFAKTSRSAKSFKDIAEELTDEKSAEFHEKWVVGYGHSSVAEHAVLHIAMENISRLAVEAVESNRLASYTEKSTRYQKWGLADFYIPREFSSDSLLKIYQTTCTMLFAAYQKSLPVLKRLIEEEDPQQEGESKPAWERRIQTAYIDECRFFLPAAALANVGMTINARALEHAIIKMLSHPLDEVRQLGAEVKRVSQEELPTLIKYAEENTYLETSLERRKRIASSLPLVEPSANWCQLVEWDVENEIRILAAGLYNLGNFTYAQAKEHARHLSVEDRNLLADVILGNLGKHDIPLRELEHSTFTFDLILDQGAYNELKRHRMMTQTAQPLTPYLGYAIPKRLARCMGDEYQTSMAEVMRVYQTLKIENPWAAAYIIPNAFNRRVLLTFNLRTAFHFLSLRTAPNAHFSIRRVARRIAEEIEHCCPLLAGYMHLLPGETWQQIENDYFARTA